MLMIVLFRAIGCPVSKHEARRTEQMRWRSISQVGDQIRSSKLREDKCLATDMGMSDACMYNHTSMAVMNGVTQTARRSARPLSLTCPFAMAIGLRFGEIEAFDK